jgi:hypothetical protein
MDMENGAAALKTVVSSQKVQHGPSLDIAILLGMYPRETKMDVHKDLSASAHSSVVCNG